MYKVLINFLCLLLILGCQKEEIAEQAPNNNFPIINNENGVIWQMPIKSDLSYSRSINPILLEDGIIVSERRGGENEIIKKFDLDSGSLIWNWNEYINTLPGQNMGLDGTVIIYDNIIVGSSYQDHYGINTATGGSEWSTLVDHRDERISSFKESYFHTMSYGRNAKSDSSSIRICNLLDGDCREVFRTLKKNNFETHITGIAIFENVVNDTLIIFQNRQIVLNPYEIKVDLHCYNITQKRMEWEHLEVDQWGNSNIRAPLIDGDYCYFVGLGSAYCFNIHTGEKVWQYDHNVAWQLSNFLIHDNNFIIKDDQSNLLAINKTTGQLSWKNDDASGCCVTMRLYGDRLYYGNSGLFIVDARNGKMLHRDLQSPNKEEYPGAEFKNTVAVDLEQKIMYATDGYFVMAMELPE